MHLLPVLLVEDQPDDQFLTLRTLKKLKIHNVAVANEGDEALKYLKGKSVCCENSISETLPKLIILDLRMPKIDGFQFLETTGLDEKLKEIPVIVLSSSPQESDRARCRELGARAYLKKPLEVDDFDRAIRKIYSNCHTR